MGILKKPRIIQSVCTVIIVMLVFLCPVSELKKLVVSFLCAFIFHHIANLYIYIDIVKHGIPVMGTLISCEPRLIIIRKEGIDFILHGYYNPTVLFFRGEKKYQIELWGAFYKQINKENENLAIIYDEKCSRVIAADPILKNTYKVHTAIWCTFLIVLILVTLLVK